MKCRRCFIWYQVTAFRLKSSTDQGYEAASSGLINSKNRNHYTACLPIQPLVKGTKAFDT